MRRMITFAFMMTMVVMMAHAQGGLKKVYNESIDPMGQIDAGLQKAKTEGKFVVCQLGGQLVSMVPEVCRFRREGYGCEPDDE